MGLSDFYFMPNLLKLQLLFVWRTHPPNSFWGEESLILFREKEKTPPQQYTICPVYYFIDYSANPNGNANRIEHRQGKTVFSLSA